MKTVETELAWAAGFFDGEGCCVLARRGAKRVGNKLYSQKVPWRIHFSINQTASTPLERFQLAVGGFGRVRGPYAPHIRNRIAGRVQARKPQWQFAAEKFSDVQEIVGRLWLYLSQPKRDQIAGAFGRYEDLRLEAHGPDWRAMRGKTRTGT